MVTRQKNLRTPGRNFETNGQPYMDVYGTETGREIAEYQDCKQ